MSAEYVKYLVDNKERINQEAKIYAEFWMCENVRIHEEFPLKSKINIGFKKRKHNYFV